MSRSGVSRVSRTMDRRRSVRRRRRGRWVGKVTYRSFLVILVAEEEGIRALLGTEDTTVLTDPAAPAGPLEADRALVQAFVLIARLAGHAFEFHGQAQTT